MPETAATTPTTTTTTTGAAAMSPVVRALRLVSIATWLPSLALSIAHGVLSRQPYPSVGLVPHTVSAILAVCLLRLPPSEPDSSSAEPDAVSEADVVVDVETALLGGGAIQRQTSLARVLHPFAVFLLDMAVCAAFAWIIVQTWIQDSPSNQIAMLAAYVTVPQMANFLANAGSGLHSIYYGLAINGFIQWVAWRAVPGDCPNCQHSLRPASLPEVPWLKRSKRRDVIAPVLVDDEQRYRDESDDVDESRDGRDRQPGAEGSSQNATTELPWGQSARGSF